MIDDENNSGDPVAPAPATSRADASDPLAIFETSPAETSGVWADVEDPRNGDLLLKMKLAHFGGVNNTAIIREERKLKAKLPQGQRRQIDAGAGDPEVVQRMNRQLFVRVSCLDWEMVNPQLKQKWGDFSQERCDELFEAYPKVYQMLSEAAIDEQNYALDRIKDTTGN